jgi:hypothetical protein
MAIKKIFASLFLIISTLAIASPPSWLASQTTNGYICGIGISNDKNPAMRERIAIVSARANLAENISVEIMSYFKMHVRVVNGHKTQLSESIIEQKAHQMLSHSKIEKRFVDTDGTLYILVTLPQTLQQMIK